MNYENQLYSKEEMVLLSLMYSRTKREGYTVPVFDHLLLASIFKASVRDHLSMFDKNNIKKLVTKGIKIAKEKEPEKNYTKTGAELRGFLRCFNYRKSINEAKEQIEIANKKDIDIITFFDERYPEQLKDLEIPPFVLYIKGEMPTNEILNKSLAIIGSRNMDMDYGAKLSNDIGKLLMENGWYNIGSLSSGTDTYAHKGSLGATGAVLGQGLATPIYPRENEKLAKKIIKKNGFIMSELPPAIKMNPISLSVKERIRSGLTKGIIVIETSDKSGSLYAVKNALEQNKKVFVIDFNNEEIKSTENISGNIELLDTSKNLSSNVVITKEEKEKIIGIKSNEDFVNYLKELENEEQNTIIII